MSQKSDVTSKKAGGGASKHAEAGEPKAGVKLTRLAVGSQALVREVQAGSVDQARLLGLGICLGRRLLLLKGGDPLIVQVYDSRVGLSARLGRQIIVDPLPEGAKIAYSKP